ncbi:hypothetical protein QF031_000025 [Pseudarthrobacter defluvii]|nr:hypothetical protein [Pseudarthrobacter defluvii]MDQ0767276.1 hypothetical protein [Pseudarthrobacter defluvii]
MDHRLAMAALPDKLVKVSEAAPLLEEKGFQAVAAAKCFRGVVA